MDHVGLSNVVCPNVSFVVDNTPPEFITANMSCLTETGGKIEQISWNVQALSGIVAMRYNISNMELSNPQIFVPFPLLSGSPSLQLEYNLRPLLQNHSGVVYLTLQAESGVGLTAINTAQVNIAMCSGN